LLLLLDFVVVVVVDVVGLVDVVVDKS